MNQTECIAYKNMETDSYREDRYIYVTKEALAAIIQASEYFGSDWSTIELRVYNLAIVRSFVDDDLKNGRPVIREKDVKRAVQYHYRSSYEKVN